MINYFTNIFSFGNYDHNNFQDIEEPHKEGKTNQRKRIYDAAFLEGSDINPSLVSPFKPRKLAKRKSLTQEEAKNAVPKHIQIPPLPTNVTPLIKSQIDLIESFWASRLFTVNELCIVRNKILAISNNSSLSEIDQLAELGMLFYYLSREEREDISRLGRQDSLMSQRYAEMEEYLTELELNHGKLGDKKSIKLLPSGCLAYLQRTLAKMVFSADGMSFNLGGCYAVKSVLSTSLNRFFTEEWRKQVLSTVDRLIADQAFQSLFMSNFNIHPTLEEYVRTDLKLPQNIPVTSALIRIDLLIAFFSLSGQVDNEGNCFGVATTGFFFENYPEVTLMLLMQGLENGNFVLGNLTIPIAPLMTNHVVYQKDFEVSEMDVVPHLIGVDLAKEILRKEEMTQVGVTLDQMFTHNFAAEAPYAKRIFSSLKVNSLHRMVFAIFLFVSNNMMSCEKIKSEKRALIDLWMKQVGKYFAGDLNLQTSIKDALLQALEKRFWFIDFQSEPTEIKGQRVLFSAHTQGIPYKGGNLEDYEEFSSIRRLTYLNEGVFLPLDSLSDLSSACCKVVDEIFASQLIPPRYSRRLTSYFRSVAFTDLNTELLVKENAKSLTKFSQLKAIDYKQANSFFLIQTGGCEKSIFSGKLTANWPQFPSFGVARKTSTPLGLLENLCQVVKKNRREKSRLLACNNEHVFTFDINLFSEFLDHPRQDLQIKLVRRGERLLNLPFEDAFFEEFISNITDKAEIDRIKQAFPKRPITNRSARDIFLNMLKKCDVKHFKSNFERKLTEVSREDILKDLSLVLVQIGITLDSHKQEEFSHRLRLKFKDESELSPYKAALFIQTVVYESNLHFVSLGSIESAICENFELPRIIEIGDLNYVGELREKPKYTKVVLKYDLTSEKIVICSRRGEKVQVMKRSDQESFLDDLSVTF